MRVPKRLVSRFLFFLSFAFGIVLLISGCGSPSVSKYELISPSNNAPNVPFNDAKLVFSTPNDKEYEVIVKKASTSDEVFKSALKGGQNIEVKIPKGKLEPSTKYKWYVRLKGDDSNSSELRYFTTKENSAPVVYNLKPDGTTDHPFGALALTWDASDPDNDDLTFSVKVYLKGNSNPIYETVVATNSAVVKNLNQLTDYVWEVRAVDSWGANSETKNAAFKTKLNDPPERIELLNPVPNSVDVKFNNLLLQWKGYDKDNEDLLYNVSLNSSQNLLSNSPLTEFKVTGLAPNTTYTITINAIDKYGQTKTQNFSFKTRANTPPDKPILKSPGDKEKINFVKVTDLTFSWSSVTDIDEDDVYYEFVLLCNGQEVHRRSPVLSNSYYINNISNLLDVGKTYTWYVISKDRHGGKTESDRFTFETYSNTPPSVPTSPYPGDNAENLPNRIPRFSWYSTDPDGDTLRYDLYIGESPDSLKLEAGGLTTNVFETPRLFEFGKTYYWKVVVSDGYNPPVEGPVWKFTITNKDNAPTVPELISPENGASGVAMNNVTLKWKASSDKETPSQNLIYYLYIGQADQITLYSTITGQTSSEISQIVSNLSPTTTYYWRVEVKDSFGNYAYSATRSFKTKQNEAPNIPTNPNPSDGSVISVGSIPTTITLSWNCSDPDEDNLSYEVYINTSTDFTSVTPYVTNTKSVQVTLNNIGKYYWYVVAKDPHDGFTKGKTWVFEAK